MLIENKLRNIKNEIPKSPSYMKAKVMSEITSPSNLHIQKSFSFKRLFAFLLIPVGSFAVLFFIVVLAIALRPAGGAKDADSGYNNGTDNNEDDNSVIGNGSPVLYDITTSAVITNNTFKFRFYYGYNEEELIENNVYETIVIKILPNNLELESSDSIIIVNNFNSIEYEFEGILSKYVEFELKIIEDYESSGTFVIKYENKTNDSSSGQNSNSEQLIIKYTISNGIITFNLVS